LSFILTSQWLNSTHGTPRVICDRYLSLLQSTQYLYMIHEMLDGCEMDTVPHRIDPRFTVRAVPHCKMDPKFFHACLSQSVRFQAQTLLNLSIILPTKASSHHVRPSFTVFNAHATTIVVVASPITDRNARGIQLTIWQLSRQLFLAENPFFDSTLSSSTFLRILRAKRGEG
jgi:hypothetical protein